jgi:cysteine desulfurase
VSIIPVDSQGTIDLNWLSDELGDDVLLVSVMAVNNEIGTIQPIEQIGKLTGKSGAFFHCDAAQAPCAIDIDVFSMGIDMLSLSAHKFYGPKGIGAAYIRRDLRKKVEPVILGGGQQNGLRGGTLPTQLCVGMGAAVELLQGEHQQLERVRISTLRNYFVEKLLESSNRVKVNGPDFKIRHPGNVNLSFGGVNAQDLLIAMQPKLAASSGSACSSGMVQPSYVLKAIGLTTEEAESSLRFGFGRFTTMDDIDESVEQICSALDRLR